ncbi:MAG: hypothetical protein ACREEM_34790 [Blastocatellia bacterium]
MAATRLLRLRSIAAEGGANLAGTFVYAAYAFYRQLPAGVQGGYRLFANIISLRKTINRKMQDRNRRGISKWKTKKSKK